ncbi:endonuclease/exonuclease/phosphatase family protein [Streptomyces sp. NPDC086023]|uniref:endonuclease/exonuclease/phosphatase family protein n=1 Tax=Streptomyces sp. NPDC086023 TaxID=3365746 RepID=UPI0037D117B8
MRLAPALLLTLLLTLPGLVPNTGPRAGSLLDTFLPWLGLGVPVLAGLALWRRAPDALCAALVPAAAWAALYGTQLLPRADAPYDLTAVQHNASDENPDPAATARRILDAEPSLVALQELTPATSPGFAAALGPVLPHHAATGTVGLWSRFPLTDVRPVPIRPRGIGEGWDRCLRATARTPHGDVAVYVAHLPSLRLSPSGGFGSARRDESAALLGAALAAEPLERVVLLGDLNGTLDDRGLAPVTSRLDPPAPAFAFSWPAAFPVARIDQVLTRRAAVTRLRLLDATPSDHLPLAARIRLHPGPPGG